MCVHGDPNRRGADHGEAFGASIKDDIHNRCLRRQKSKARVEHKKLDAAGNVIKRWWQAGLSVSRIAQIWRDIAVRSALLRDAESQPYLQRRHHTLSSTGFATGGQAAAVSRRKVGERSIHEIIAEARDCA